MLITISRQFGAGGSSVADLVARRLGWTVVDNELIDRVAVRAGLSPQQVAAQEETAPGLLERIVLALAASSQEILTPQSAQALKPLEEPRLVEITDAGHLVNLARPAEFNAAVRRFLAERAPPPASE